MTYLTQDLKRPEIGRGRSGIVYLQDTGEGSQLACKVFDSRGLTKVVQILTLGAPNPYVWNADAVQCARLRRNILEALVPIWTDGKVGVAEAVAALRNDEHQTFELQTRMVRGWAAHLHHPLSDEFDGEAEGLWHDAMPSLRKHLTEAGFDGLLWQAGEGNPVALNNFLFEPDRHDAPARDGTPPTGRWIWIDLESGVPAIFPLSLKVLFSYSLRHWRRLGRPMFDDVDVGRLTAYLEENADALKHALGAAAYDDLVANARHLGEHQSRWKSVGRHDSSIQYRLMRGDIDQAEAAYFTEHRLRWRLTEAKRALLSLGKALKAGGRAVAGLVRRINLTKAVSSTWKYLASQTYRETFIQDFLRQRIEKWQKRGQLNDRDAQRLLEQVGAPDASVYMTDFGIHLAIKPAVKAVQYWVLPALFAFGVLNAATLAVLILAGGSLARSAYTLGRLLQSAARGAEKPWIALWVGVLPIVGNLAYPAQMIYSSGGKDEKLAQFMMDDGFARVGRHLPIWGGEDTWTEHAWNRVPYRISRYLKTRWQRKTSELSPTGLRI
ncbi:MAG: hypothetical protein AAF678_07915 [Pseudomonadota bacterium]